MRRILLCIVFVVYAGTAFAGWNKAEWGMTLEQVEQALGVTLIKIDAKPNQYGNLKYSLNGQNVGLVCTVTDKGLESIGIAVVGEAPCNQQYVGLLETHGKPGTKTDDGGKLITAAWTVDGTRIDFLWGKGMPGEISSICSITYSPAM